MEKVLINGINYELDSATRTASVCSLDNKGKYEGDIVILSSISHNGVLYSVISIHFKAFDGCTDLASITIPNSVISIKYGAFYDCIRLTSVSIPNSVTSIGGSAFFGCTSLTSITIPNSVTNIGDDVFRGCTGLTSIVVERGNTIYDSRNNCNAIIETATNTLIQGCNTTTIPNSVTSIGRGAFGGCSGLTSIAISDGVVSIGDGAFSGCTGLTSFAIPNGVANIGRFIFTGCKSLTSIIIPNSVTSIGSFFAFFDLPSLTSIIVEEGNAIYDSRNNCNAIIETATNTLIQGCNTTIIPDGVTSIGVGAFSGCTNLISISIPDSVMSIEGCAFFGCTNLVSITISNSITSIKKCAFESTPWFENLPDGVIYIGSVLYKNKGDMPENTSVVIKEGIVSIAEGAFFNCEGLVSINIPNSVTHIGASVFSGCTNLTSITIPNSVTSIGGVGGVRGATFARCTSLSSITIPDSVTDIGESTFSGCTNLTSITMSNSVTSVKHGIFHDCSNLSSYIIPNGVTFIEWGAFDGCTGLASVTIPNSVTKIGDLAFRNCASLVAITVPDSVTSIGEQAFCDCKKLTSITIPDSVTNIGKQAFAGCSQLVSCNIPTGMSIIAHNIFGGCINLKSIVIPENITRIENQAFYNCASLGSVVIPKSITNIGSEYVFAHCSNLTSIAVDKENSVYDSRNECNAIIETKTDTLLAGCHTTIIPNTVRRIGKTAFYECWRMAFIHIPNSVEDIGKDAFGGCSSLTSITIPDSVNTIAKDAFYECKQLRTIRIPKGKKSIFCEDDLRALIGKIIEYKESLIGDIQYELDDNLTAIVCAKTDKYAGDIVIPTRVEQDGSTYTIDRIAQDAFRDCYDLTSVTLPKTITEIGADIFSGCENLQTIRVPQGMTEAFCKMGLEPWRDKIVEPRQEEYTILLNIARGYELGIGMARNLAQAVLCYVQAADKGCADAAYHLGELYEEGKALPQDYQQAADWFAKASQLYHPNGEARRQACLRVIEEENARLSAFQEEQRATRQAQLAQLVAAQKPQKTILFFDTETNGLPANYKLGVTATDNWPRLIQLGWIITDESGNILKRKSQLIYPQSFTIDADVTRLTGITTADAQRNGVALSDVLSKFMADVESASLLVGHNVDFDMHIMGCELYRMGMNYQALIEKPSVCTMVRSTNFCAIPSTSRYYSGYKFPSLTELYTKLFGYAFSGAHDALSDITATKDCYFELLRRGII